eukprot:46043_1
MKLSIWFIYGCMLWVLIDECICSPYDCLNTMYNTNQTWLAMHVGISFAGHTLYFANGTLIAYDNHGNIVNEGTYKVSEGDDYCYQTETYSYPLLEKCATYSVLKDDKNNVFYIGCAIVGIGCQSLEECDPDWHDWYTTRVTGPVVPS